MPQQETRRRCDSGDSAVVCGDEFTPASVNIASGNANISDPVSSASIGFGPVRCADETRPVNAYVNFIIKF